MPRIRLELQHMQQAIVQALGQYNQDIEQYVNQELQRVIDEFDFAAIVREAAEAAMKTAVNDSINNYFRYGEGGKRIDEIVKQAMSRGNTY